MLNRKEQLAILVVAAVVLFGIGYKYAQVRLDPASAPVIEKAEDSIEYQLQIHVAGEVAAPGVYELPAGSRVKDALKLAEPLTTGDLHALNLAAPLQDGDRIILPPLPVVSEESESKRDTAGAGNSTISINRADASQLQKLPGIGPALADRIISHREQNGPFTAVEELQNVAGIGEKRIEEIRELITVY